MAGFPCYDCGNDKGGRIRIKLEEGIGYIEISTKGILLCPTCTAIRLKKWVNKWVAETLA